MNSYMQKKETVTRNWYVIDAEGKPLGRVASKAAVLLRGKHKPTFFTTSFFATKNTSFLPSFSRVVLIAFLYFCFPLNLY